MGLRNLGLKRLWIRQALEFCCKGVVDLRGYYVYEELAALQVQLLEAERCLGLSNVQKKTK